MKKILEIIEKFPQDIQNTIALIDKEVLDETEEIQLRTGKPLCISAFSKLLFIGENGEIYNFPNNKCINLSKNHIKETFKRVCSYSVHSYEREIKNGYITIKGGHRVGICGEAIYDGETLKTIDNISSLNIRIAREKNGLAKELFDQMPLDSVGGFIIAGSPKSGKTTLLRDIARYIASGENELFKKVCIIDERCEIASMYGGEAQNDIGICCDILSGYKKSDGINIAIRTMSPDYIICDEIALDSEIEAVYKGVNSGTKVITTVHAKDVNELIKKPFIKKLIDTNAFDAAVFLSSEKRGKVENIIGLNNILKELTVQK